MYASWLPYLHVGRGKGHLEPHAGEGEGLRVEELVGAYDSRGGGGGGSVSQSCHIMSSEFNRVYLMIYRCW